MKNTFLLYKNIDVHINSRNNLFFLFIFRLFEWLHFFGIRFVTFYRVPFHPLTSTKDQIKQGTASVSGDKYPEHAFPTVERFLVLRQNRNNFRGQPTAKRGQCVRQTKYCAGEIRSDVQTVGEITGGYCTVEKQGGSENGHR